MKNQMCYVICVECLWSFTSVEHTAFTRDCIGLGQGYCTYYQYDLTYIIETADDTLFKQILTHPNHTLAPLLPEIFRFTLPRPRNHEGDCYQNQQNA